MVNETVVYKKSTNLDLESDIYRHVKHPEYLIETPVKEIETMDQLFDYCVQKYADRPCIGKRELIKVHRTIKKFPNGTEKIWEIPEFGTLKYQTYKEIQQRITHVARGLVQYCGINSGDRFGMFENTCAEWWLTAQAAYKYNITLVTVYANLGEDALIHSLNETKVQSLLTNEEQLPRFHLLCQKIPSLRNIVYVSSAPKEMSKEEQIRRESIIQKLRDETELNLISFDDLEKLGASISDEAAIKVRKPSKNKSLAIIMYTSGTTGIPKGVQILHRNILAAVAGVSSCVDLEAIEEPPVYIGFLPLAHILETVAEAIVLFHGGRIGYGNPRTLSDTGAKPCGDFSAIKPNIVAGVPRIFDTVKKTIVAKLEEPGTSPIKKWLFDTAYAAKKAAYDAGRDTPLWNAMIFNKLAGFMGGNVKAILSGGAPLSSETQEFVRICFGVPTLQGYGLTETTAALTANSILSKMATGCIGPPVPSCELKLVSIPEMNYKASDPRPRGEICTRGPCVTDGYFNKQSEDYDKDGWFHTGDIGTIEENGQLKIIDRKKNLVKLDHGEYVAIEKIESAYSNSPFVSPNGLFIYGDSQHSYVVGILLPAELTAKNWARQHSISDDLNNLIKDPEFKKAVKLSLEKEAKKNNLKSIELMQDFVIVNDEWTPENGLLTAAMKLKRNELKEKYKKEIDEMYARSNKL